jgi:hypothetical protein
MQRENTFCTTAAACSSMTHFLAAESGLLVEYVVVDLCLVVAVGFDIGEVDPELLSNLADVLWRGRLGDFDV